MTDENPDDSDRVEELAEKVDALEQQVDALTPDVSRRQALEGGAALGLGALIGGGATLGATQSARAAPDADDVGTPSDHVDIYAQNLYDVNGNQYDRFSELGYIEDSNSPYSSPSFGASNTLADTPSEGMTTVLVALKQAGDPVFFRVNGDATSNYKYNGFNTSRQTGATKGRIGDTSGRNAVYRLNFYYSQFQTGMSYDTQHARGEIENVVKPDTFTILAGGDGLIRKLRAFHISL